VSGSSAPLPCWLGALVVLSACSLPAPESPLQNTASPDHLVAPAQVDLGGAPLTPGGATLKVSVVGQGPRQLLVSVPEGPGPHPLAIFLHGAGPAERYLHGIIECLVEPGLEPLHPVILAPLSSSQGQWWTEADISFVLGLIEAARERWPIEREHTLLLGYSNGGIGTWFFARQYPGSFSAAIPMAANDTIMGPAPLPVYAIQGTKDELFPIESIRPVIQQLRAQGQNVTLNEKYRGTHMQACSYMPELEAASAWLGTSVWNGGHSPSASGAPR
jgi:dienelactone hydrolase